MASHDVVCLHTMGGFLVSTEELFRSGGWTGTESHFGVGGKWGPDVGPRLDGALYQWQDLAFQADANLDGNHRVISIETADNGGGVIEPWTPAQIETVVRLIDWLCDPASHARCPSTWTCHQVGIPRSLVPSSCGGHRGIAYHRLGIVPSSPNRPDGPWLQPGCEQWSDDVGKICPGDARIDQIKTVVVPRVAARDVEDDFLALFNNVNEFKAAVREAVQSELSTIGDPTRTMLVRLTRQAVAAEFEQVGSPTRTALIELLRREIESPTGDLHVALKAVLEEESDD